MLKAVICETAYQMFNALNIVINDKDNIYDIYIGTYHEELLKYSSDLSLIINIRNVFYFDSSSKKQYRIVHKVQRVIDYFFPRLSLHLLTQDYKKTKKIKYDIVFIATPNPYMVNFLFCHNEAMVYFYEDGTGSYHGKIGENISTSISKFCEKIFKRGPSLILPQKIYLYNPEISNNTYGSIIEKIYPFTYYCNEEEKNRFERIFCVNNEIKYEDYDFVYLGQAYSAESYCYQERKILELMSELSCNTLIRPHPDSDYSEYDNLFPIDTELNQWEIICGSEIDTKSILIATYSTAQLIPKNIFDKEPYVIFTFLLYNGCFSKEQKKEISINIKKFEESYLKENRIFVPTSMGELKMIIKKLINH